MEDLRRGGLTLPVIEPTTSDLSGLQGPGGEPAVGVLGSDALSRLVVVLDFAGGRVALAAPSEAVARAAECGRVVATRDDNGILRLDASIDGQALPLRYDFRGGLVRGPPRLDQPDPGAVGAGARRAAGTGPDRDPRRQQDGRVSQPAGPPRRAA